MTKYTITSLPSGDVRVDQEYFNGDDYVTMTRTFTVHGHYVYQVMPNGTLSQTCEGLRPTGPTLRAGDDLEATIRKSLGRHG